MSTKCSEVSVFEMYYWGLLGERKAAVYLSACGVLGGIIAVLLEMARVPALAFGLGMYLPIEINIAVFFGAAVGHFVGKTGKDEEEKAARKEQGTLIASGVMAGAAIVGTIGAILLLPQVGAPMQHRDLHHLSEQGAGVLAGWYDGWWGQFVSVLGLAGLVLACYFLAKVGARWQLKEEREAEQLE